MPRTNYLRDPYEKRREKLFGTEKNPVSICKMSRETDITRSTLQRYKKYPETIPFRNLLKIIKWNRLTKEEIGDLFT